MSRLQRNLLSSNWEFRAASWPEPPEPLGYSRMEWLPAQVPGHVHTDLLRLGVIQDPFIALGELGCQWVDEETWLYRTRLLVEKSPELPCRVLRFAGLDTICRVSIDGIKVAQHDNMHVPLEIDISQLTPGDHELSIAFFPAKQEGERRRALYFEQESLAANTTRFDERAFVRKAQYMFGWDWGPRLISAGIHLPVEVLAFEARLTSVWVRQQHHGSGRVSLHAETTLDQGSADEDLQVVHFLLDPDGRQLSTALSNTTEFILLKPELWWPSGWGKQALYRWQTYLVPADASPKTPELAEQVALDSSHHRIGLRTIELRQELDQIGESFEFLVNGERLYALGANWIPDHSFPSAVTREQYRSQLKHAKELGMNMLRVWGGGLYEHDEFYEAADELGLLVWQDFPFACSHYPDGPPQQASAAEEASANIVRLRNHPSLALWCGNNENQEMFDKGWEGRERHPSRLYGQKLYEGTLPETLARLDPDRPYVRSSPDRGELASDGRFGDEHYWDVWHGRGDWKYYEDSRGRFASEFGFASAPGPRTMAQIHPHADALEQPKEAREFRFHDKTLKGFDTFVGYVELHYPVAHTAEEWLYYSQLNQRDALRCGIEHFRRGTDCRGSLIWQYNDCYPAQSWAVRDYQGDDKAAAFELRRLYDNLLISFRRDRDKLSVLLVLDNQASDLRSTLEVQATGLSDGSVLRRQECEVHLKPGERSCALALDVHGLDAQSTLVTASYAGRSAVRLLGEPKFLHQNLPRIGLKQESTGELSLRVDRPVIDLFLWDPTGQVQFPENFLTYPRAGTYPLTAKASPEELPRLQARCLAGKVSLKLD